MTGEGRVFLPAVIPPWAAYVFARDFGDRIERKAAEMRAAQPAVAEQMLIGLASLREAGRQRSEAHAQAANGRSELPIERQRAVSVMPSGGASGVTTGVAATRLGVTERQVINLIVRESLVADKPKGRWVIDEVSLVNEIERRRA